MREAVPVALRDLLRGIRQAPADPVEDASRPIGNAPVQLADGVAVERPAGWVRRVLADSRQSERLAVVERCVAAAMTDDDRMLDRHLVEIVNVERALVLHFRVVEEEPFDPRSGRRLPRLCPELLDDAADGDEFDFEGIADEDLEEQDVAARMIVTVGEARHDGHLPGVERPGVLADEASDVRRGAHRNESVRLTAKASTRGSRESIV